MCGIAGKGSLEWKELHERGLGGLQAQGLYVSIKNSCGMIRV